MQHTTAAPPDMDRVESPRESGKVGEPGLEKVNSKSHSRLFVAMSMYQATTSSGPAVS